MLWFQLAGFTGVGVTVCSVDTGVRWTHEALEGTYRGDVENHDYNWFGPGSSNYPVEPTDGNGHGTHVTGTMAGDGPGPIIGMAPGAQWIAARAQLIPNHNLITRDTILTAVFLVACVSGRRLQPVRLLPDSRPGQNTSNPHHNLTNATMDFSNASARDLQTMSLQFSGCPTRSCNPELPTCDPTPDCTVAPDVVSNSWGGGRGSSAFW